jgi:hypothetical protein
MSLGIPSLLLIAERVPRYFPLIKASSLRFATHRSSKSPVIPPVDRFYQVLLYVDREGNTQVDGAATVPVEDQQQILQAALPTYHEVLARIEANDSLLSFGPQLAAVHHDGNFSSPCIAMKPNAGSRTSHPSVKHQSKSNSPVHQRYTAFNAPLRSNKRLRASSEDGPSRLHDDSKNHSSERSNSIRAVENHSQLIPIEIGDSKKLKEYLLTAFTSFQQINCRTICKSWIRTIEPKKQVNHPYNGNLKVNRGQKFPSDALDPEETKPKWWPSKEECPHKEPDHINKERWYFAHFISRKVLIIAERLALLCHILMNTLELHGCNTDDLKAALEADKAKIKPAGKEEILSDVWKIGRQREIYNSGGKGKKTYCCLRPGDLD